MDDHETRAGRGRRQFLKLATLAPAAAVSVAAGTGEAEAEQTDEPQGSGLRKTAHVKAYLDSARF